MSINLKLLKLDELLARMGKTEENISVTNGTHSDGWVSTLAWNPVDKFELNFDKTDNTTEMLEKFIIAQQAAGRLCVGYLSYDFGRILHNVATRINDDLRMPLVLVYSYDNWVNFADTESDVNTVNDEFTQNIEDIMSRKSRKIPEQIYNSPLKSVWSRGAYNKAYRKVHEYIKAGDIYQVNLTHRLEGISNVDAIDIYRASSSSSNANFQSYIAGSNFEIISASPERFVRIAGGVIETSPIKGTRPRSKDLKEDEALRDDLQFSSKEHAELDMITDLMRNDLGVVSEIGTVRVVDERIITSYPTVWHAHSTITSKLKHDVSPIAALASLMPGGSITGTPKKRAIEIIDELEQHNRGIYTGSIFVVQPNGDLDSNIAIRTMIKKDNKLYLSVGGGIVYDSTENDEYEESLHKAAVFTNLDDFSQ